MYKNIQKELPCSGEDNNPSRCYKYDNFLSTMKRLHLLELLVNILFLDIIKHYRLLSMLVGSFLKPDGNILLQKIPHTYFIEHG